MIWKFLQAYIVIFLGSFLFSCSKKETVTNKMDTSPLPGTVDKTDTLRVMAYNVFNYGDLCQGNTTSLDSYFKTIIQFTQPDLMSCEKMTAFSYSQGAAGNLADDIIGNVLNVVNPDK